MLKRVHRLREQLPSSSGAPADIDIALLGAVLALLAIGLVMVGSASMDVSEDIFGDPLRIVIKQSVFMAIGLLVAGGAMLFPIERIQRWSAVGLLVTFILLVLVLIVGREINGSTRWIPLGFFNLQASEVAKLGTVIYMAGYLVRHLDQVRSKLLGFIKPMIIMGLLAGLLLAEPDFGALVVLAVAMTGMIFMAGTPIKYIAAMIAFFGALGVAVVIFEPYRMARVISYTDPWAHAYGSGYQLTQALIAFGRGAWFGEGLGNSIQKLFYLPEAHTDFIFAVLAEEFGVVGSLAVLALFLFVTWRSLQLGVRAEAKGMLYHAYVAYGITLLFASQALINLGVNTGALPTKGLALPMISYGGSSLLVNCLAFGILLRIDFERRRASRSQPVTGNKKHKASDSAGGSIYG